MLKTFIQAFTDSTKRFEDRVLNSTQTISYCLNQWYLDLSDALQPLFVHNDIQRTFELYSAFLYKQSQYQIPVHQALALIHEAESRLTDVESRLAMTEIRLGTILVFRWLDDQSIEFPINPCFAIMHHHTSQGKKFRFGNNIKNTWALLKSGKEFLFERAITLEEFLKSDRKIVFPDGPEISIDDVSLFLKSQMDAINSIIVEIAYRVGIINAKIDFLKNIDLKSPKFNIFTYDTFSESIDLTSTSNKIVILYRMAKNIWEIDLDKESKKIIDSNKTSFL